MLTSTASWMVARNDARGICGLISNAGVNQLVSNVEMLDWKHVWL